MRLNLKGIGAAALGLSACALGFVACGVDSAPSLTLSSFHSLEPDGENTCSVDTDPYSGGAYFAAEGARTGQGYIVYVRIENSMPPNDDDELGRLDTNWVQLTEVEIFYPRQGPWSYLPASRKQPAGVKIDSQGELFHAVTAIDGEIAALMVEGTEGAPSPIASRGTCESILLTFQARGKLGDGSSIETNKIDFPVNVCNVFNPCPVIEEGCSTAQPDGFTCGELDEEPGGPGAGGSGGLPGTGGTGGDDTGAGGAGGDLGTGGIGGDLGTGGIGGIGGDLGTGGDGGSII